MTIRSKILAIDDESNIRRLLTNELEREGFRVATAASGEQGLALPDKECFDLATILSNCSIWEASRGAPQGIFMEPSWPSSWAFFASEESRALVIIGIMLSSASTAPGWRPSAR